MWLRIFSMYTKHTTCMLKKVSDVMYVYECLVQVEGVVDVLLDAEDFPSLISCVCI